MEPRRDAGESAQRPATTLVSRTCELPESSLVSLLAVRPGPRVVWTAPAEPDLVGLGVAAELTTDGPGRFDAVREAATALFESVDLGADAPAVARPRLLGGFAFHDEHAPAPPWTGFPGARFVLPRLQFARVDGSTWLTVNAVGPEVDSAEVEADLDAIRADFDPSPRSPGPAPGYVETERTTSRADWRVQVEAALSRIASGDLEKVALAQSLSVELGGPFSLSNALANLGERYPDCFRFAVDPGAGATFFGATPERLVSVRGSRVETEALAGSIERGDSPEADERLADALRDSPKDSHEHAVVVDAVREQLEPVAERVQTGERAIRRLASVQHLRTPITADLDQPMHVLSLVQSLHPTPAVGGVPPDVAWQTIEEAETFDRGWYAGPVGWFDAAGDGSFAVGIRSAVASESRGATEESAAERARGEGRPASRVVRPEGAPRIERASPWPASRASLFAGAGIVADSDPDAEWDEVQLKYRPILDVLE